MKIIKQLVLDISGTQATLSRLKWERHYYIEQLQVVCKQIEEIENPSVHIATIKKDMQGTVHDKIDDDTWIKYKGENLMFEDSKAEAFKSMAILLGAAKEREADLMKALVAIRSDMRSYRKACALLGEEVLKGVLAEEVKAEEHQDKAAKEFHLSQLETDEDEDEDEDEDGSEEI